MFGRTAIFLVAGVMLIAWSAQAANADQYIELNEKFTMNGKLIDVYVIGLNIASEPISNIHYDVDPKTVNWVRLIYQFDNRGDFRDEAFITPVLVDSNGNEYRYKTNEPTTVWVKPHFRTGSLFVEIPVTKNVTLTKIIFRDGTIDHHIEIHSSTVTPVPASTPTASSTPTPGGASWHDCIPLIPFAMAGGLAAAGMVINRSGIIKR